MERLKHHTHRALRHSEKYFKTDMVYLAKGGFWLTTGQGVASLASLVLAIAFANLLPKEAYGNYKYILAVVGVLTLFGLTGIGQALARSVAQGFEGSAREALRVKLTWGLLGGLASFTLALYYALHQNTLLATSFFAAGFFMPFFEAYSLYDAVLQGRKDFYRSTTYYIIAQSFCALVSLATLWFTKSIPLLVLAYLISWVFIRVVLTFRLFVSIDKEAPSDEHTISYGKHLSAMNILTTLSSYADRIMLFQFIGGAEAAIYSIAIAIPEQSKGVFKNISTLAFPKFAEKTFAEIQKTVYSKLILAGIAILGAAGIYIAIAPYVFSFLFPQYKEAVLYSQIFALSLFTVISVIPISILQAHKKTQDLYLYSLSTPIIQLILFAICIPTYGIMGAVISRVIARFIGLVLSLVILKRASSPLE